MNDEKKDEISSELDNKALEKDILNNEIDQILKCMSDPLDFEILMYFIMMKELTLTQIKNILAFKGRTTIYRHLQNLLSANLIYEDREEDAKGPIKVKIYKMNFQQLNKLPHISPEQIQNMNNTERNNLYLKIREALYPTLTFMQNSLDKLNQFLKLLQPLPSNDLLDVFNRQNFHLNLNFFTEEQLNLFLKDYTIFAKEFYNKISKNDNIDENAEFSYIFMMGILPIKEIMEKIVQNK